MSKELDDITAVEQSQITENFTPRASLGVVDPNGGVAIEKNTGNAVIEVDDNGYEVESAFDNDNDFDDGLSDDDFEDDYELDGLDFFK